MPTSPLALIQRVPARAGVNWQPPPAAGQLDATVHSRSPASKLAKLQRSGLGAVHLPPWQVSWPLQALPSLQESPFVFGWIPQMPLVHTLSAQLGSGGAGQVLAFTQVVPATHSVVRILQLGAFAGQGTRVRASPLGAQIKRAFPPVQN
jgi:hypothetical protein